MMQGIKTIPAKPRNALWRTLETFCISRIVIALVLLIFVFVSTKVNLETDLRYVHWGICAVYLAMAMIFAIVATYVQRRLLVQLTAQVLVDIGVISMLYMWVGGIKSGLAILYLFPLAGGAILAPLVLALFFTSTVTFVLLTVSAYQIVGLAADISMLPSGLYGASFFAAVFVINRLAAKLIRQENLALQRGYDLQLQEAINRLVIADMDDGILVVDADTRIFACNPAAERMLGLTASNGQSSESLRDTPSLAPIIEAFSAWSERLVKEKSDASGPSYIKVKPADDVTTIQLNSKIRDSRRELGSRLKLRFVSVKAAGLGEDRVVIFLQDVTEIENQAQQLKLASMGRLTASVAHEVRNPLSAIGHAASLLKEEANGPTEARLLKIIGDNVARLNRLIEDILKLSRKAQSDNAPIALAPFFADILDEFQQTHAIKDGLIVLGDMRRRQVRFDPLHLREVIVNLLSNALRYASGQAGSIRIHAFTGTSSRLELHIQDDGPGIKPDVRAHLFEPFYTTSSKGTGLGLYVARELCLNNGAVLDYEYRVNDSRAGWSTPTGRFVIAFPASELD